MRIESRCERMPYALCLIVLGILVDESTRVDIHI